MGNILTKFNFQGENLSVKFIETTQVEEGVECDVYEFVGDTGKDLGIIRVKSGSSTPKQRILKGEKTIEGFISGSGKLCVIRGEKQEEYKVGGGNFEIELYVGDIMQWTAEADSIFYEICYPPYENDRFEEL